MPSTTPSDEASAHVLDAAERMFLEQGYAGARLQTLATALGIRPASLYHHAPGGKQELWERIVRRAFERHREGLTMAATGAGLDVRAQFGAMAGWLLSQPPVNVASVAASPQAPGGESAARTAMEHIYEGLMTPVADVFRAAQRRGDVLPQPDPDLLAGVFVAALNGLLPAAQAGVLPKAKEVLAAEIVDLLLDGIRPR